MRQIIFRKFFRQINNKNLKECLVFYIFLFVKIHVSLMSLNIYACIKKFRVWLSGTVAKPEIDPFWWPEQGQSD